MIHLINPAHAEPNIDHWNLGLLLVASSLQSRGLPVKLYMNYNDHRDYDLSDAIYVGISAMTTQYPAALELTQAIKDRWRVPVVWGGAHAELGPLLLERHPEIDFCVRGPGEVAAEQLYDWQNGLLSDLHTIPGLVFRDKGIICNPRATAQSCERLDYSLDFQPVDRCLAGQPVRQVPIFTSMGCPYRCTFCINSARQSPIVVRDIDTVMAEIRQVLALGADSVFFADELFVLDRRRLEQYLDRFTSLDFTWFAHARADHLPSDETLKRMRDLGCLEIHMGIESGSQAMLDRMKKRLRIKAVIPALERIIAAGILPKINFIFGMLGETVEDVKETVYLLMEIAERFAGQVILMNFWYYPLPGTPMAEQTGMGYEHMIQAIIDSVHPPMQLYDWLPDKAFFQDCWRIGRMLSEATRPYSFSKAYTPNANDWTISEATIDRLLEVH